MSRGLIWSFDEVVPELLRQHDFTETDVLERRSWARKHGEDGRDNSLGVFKRVKAPVQAG